MLTLLERESLKNLGLVSATGPFFNMMCCLVGGIAGSPVSPFTEFTTLPDGLVLVSLLL